MKPVLPVASYFRRFGFCERQIAAQTPPDLGLSVVIPCYDEPDLIGSLEALRACERTKRGAEVIVVINSSAESRDEVRRRNLKTFDLATAWAEGHSGPGLQFHVLHFPDLPPKQAGVGLARKIGMDEALRRFDEAGNLQGVIACFDADCRCERNYLTSLERHFERNPRSIGCSIYFEHPLAAGPGTIEDEAIAAYELHLRYYVQGLRFAGFPYAHHTIGSSMAVRARTYLEQGGMNKRQAGEDFYFLQKVMPHGQFTDLKDTTVFPSPRPSHRMPFGTGKAVRDYLSTGESRTYPLQAFLDLRVFFEYVSEEIAGGRLPSWLLPGTQPESVRSFLQECGFAEAMQEIRENTASKEAFRKRFFGWFDGFRVMKFMHHGRDKFYGGKMVAEEAEKLLRLMGEAKGFERGKEGTTGVFELLQNYRRLER